MPKSEGYYITKDSQCYHASKECASRGGSSNLAWYANANDARMASQTLWAKKVERCKSCCN